MGSSTASRPKTSLTHPLRIDAVEAPGGGLIGMTLCPGKMQPYAASGTWDRDLGLDLVRIQEWGAVAVVTLMEAFELAEYHVERIGAAVEALGMEWHHLPIVDVDVPREPFETGWVWSGPTLRGHLSAGRRILLHCRGGLGRTARSPRACLPNSACQHKTPSLPCEQHGPARSRLQRKSSTRGPSGSSAQLQGRRGAKPTVEFQSGRPAWTEPEHHARRDHLRRLL